MVQAEVGKLNFAPIVCWAGGRWPQQECHTFSLTILCCEHPAFQPPFCLVMWGEHTSLTSFYFFIYEMYKWGRGVHGNTYFFLILHSHEIIIWSWSDLSLINCLMHGVQFIRKFGPYMLFFCLFVVSLKHWAVVYSVHLACRKFLYTVKLDYILHIILHMGYTWKCVCVFSLTLVIPT